MLLRAFSWSISFVLLAKGVGRIYLITEVLADSITFVLNIVGYQLWGLVGVGVAYLLGFLFSSVGLYLLCRIKYGLAIPRRVFMLLALSTVGCMAVLLLFHGGYVVGAWIATAVVVVFAGLQLKKRLA